MYPKIDYMWVTVRFEVICVPVWELIRIIYMPTLKILAKVGVVTFII